MGDLAGAVGSVLRAGEGEGDGEGARHTGSPMATARTAWQRQAGKGGRRRGVFLLLLMLLLLLLLFLLLLLS